MLYAQLGQKILRAPHLCCCFALPMLAAVYLLSVSTVRTALDLESTMLHLLEVNATHGVVGRPVAAVAAAAAAAAGGGGGGAGEGDGAGAGVSSPLPGAITPAAGSRTAPAIIRSA